MRILGSSSCFPFASAPMAFMCVPSRTQSSATIGVLVGVVVTSMSQSHTSLTLSAITMSHPRSTITSLNRVQAAAERSMTLTASISRTREIACSWVSACRPAPTMPTTVASRRASLSAATPPAAPVRTSVRYVPLITARGAPVPIEFSTTTAITVGNPSAGLPGCTLTIFTPAIPALSRYAGMVRRSPVGK